MHSSITHLSMYCRLESTSAKLSMLLSVTHRVYQCLNGLCANVLKTTTTSESIFWPRHSSSTTESSFTKYCSRLAMHLYVAAASLCCCAPSRTLTWWMRPVVGSGEFQTFLRSILCCLQHLGHWGPPPIEFNAARRRQLLTH